MSSQPVDVVKVARRTFSEEEEDETIQIPPNYLDSLTTFFAHYPYDDLFIIAKGEGNGLGVITCEFKENIMNEKCEGHGYRLDPVLTRFFALRSSQVWRKDATAILVSLIRDLAFPGRKQRC